MHLVTLLHRIVNAAFACILSLSLFMPAPSVQGNQPLWRADFEEGDLSYWYAPCPNIRRHPARVAAALCGETGGGEFHDDDGRSLARFEELGKPVRGDIVIYIDDVEITPGT